jgi:hypothetical protein
MASPPDDKRKDTTAFKSSSRAKDGKRLANGVRPKRKNGSEGTVVIASNGGHQNGNVNGTSKTKEIKSAIRASQHEKQKHEMRRKFTTRLLTLVGFVLLYCFWKLYLRDYLVSVSYNPMKSFAINEWNIPGTIHTRHDDACESGSLEGNCSITSTEENNRSDDSIVGDLLLDQVTSTEHNTTSTSNHALVVINEKNRWRRRIGNPFRFVWKKLTSLLNRIRNRPNL